MKFMDFEKNFSLLALGALVFFSVGASITAVFPPFIDDTLVKSPVPLGVYLKVTSDVAPAVNGPTLPDVAPPPSV